MAVVSCGNIVRNLLSNSKSVVIRRFTRRFSDLNTVAEVTKRGYECEVHHTVTEDGYNLTLHRILGCKFRGSGRAPVMIQHGLSCSSTDWVVMDGGLVYRLVDEGVDVWLGNTRGNMYSRSHITHTSNSPEFWDFSWHEMGYYDLPAMIDYILDKTESKSLTYVGHSQGSCIFFVMASTRPEYNKKVRSMFGLAPIACLENMGSVVLKQVAQWFKTIQSAASIAGISHISVDTTDAVTKLFSTFQEKGMSLNGSMFYGISSLWGYPCENVKPRIFHLWAGHAKNGLSIKQLAHFAQSVRGEYRFHFYDHGPEMNTRLYGQPCPPPYPLHDISTPIYLIYGPADWLAHPRDVHVLYDALTTEKKLIEVPLSKYNHLDFCWSTEGLEDLLFRILSTT